MTAFTYNNIGKLITRYLLPYVSPDGNGNRTVCNINTSNRRIIIKLNKNQDKVMWRALVTEMGNHVDTHCFGADVLPIKFTLEEYIVYTFLPEYLEQANMPIYAGITALTPGSVKVVILEFGNGIWFGNIMDK